MIFYYFICRRLAEDSGFVIDKYKLSKTDYLMALPHAASHIADEEAAVFMYRKKDGAVGFAHCQLRHDYVEGTESSPVGYLEGIYVKETDRGEGIARKLLTACEDWAGEKGCAEFASDCEVTNTVSQHFHEAVGFEEANRLVAYVRKI